MTTIFVMCEMSAAAVKDDGFDKILKGARAHLSKSMVIEAIRLKIGEMNLVKEKSTACNAECSSYLQYKATAEIAKLLSFVLHISKYK